MQQKYNIIVDEHFEEPTSIRALVILAVLALCGFLIAGHIGISRKERSECSTWNKQNSEFAQWQKEQCLNYGVTLK